MTKNLIKSVFLTNVPLTACIVVCLLVSNFLILYEYSFMTKLTYANGDNQYRIDTEGESIVNVQTAVSELSNDFFNIIYIFGNGLVAVDDMSDCPIVGGRRPVNDNEALSASVEVPIGATVHYGEKSYTVVGKTVLDAGEVVISASAVVPETSVAGLTLRAYMMNRKKAYGKLTAQFGAEQITPPEKINAVEVFIYNPVVILLIVLLLLAVFTYVICFNYLFRKTQKPFTVYLFLGYSADYLISRLLMLVFCCVAVNYAVSAGAFAIYDAVSAMSATTIYPVTLAFTDYLLVFAVFLVLSIPMFIPVVRDLFRKSVRYKYV